MKKQIACGLFALAAVFWAYAGDSAVLVDNGFSADGNYYIFGQYGKTDKTFQGWAELFTVDVAANAFVDGGVFQVKPSAATADKSGKEVYEALAGRSYYFTKKYNCSPAAPDQILYIRDEERKSGTDEIEFQDFIRAVSDDRAFYRVQLVPQISGSGQNVASSFFIMLEKHDENGTVLARQRIGSPSVVRRGVKGYKIERIVCDKTGSRLVFVIEKTTEDKTGINIRYMVEAAVLDDAFFRNAAPATGRTSEMAAASDAK
ncbi:MAG: DUF2259 domain-containing protein [Treponemataceae bacterium]|nr:DUF2259 domain-containing protein [Treponemataceae bacterium]